MVPRPSIVDHYGTLGVDRRAKQSQIKAAFRALALKWHPDKWSGEGVSADARSIAEERFKEISHAYDVLSDEHKKIVYDASLVSGGRGVPERNRKREQAPPAETEFASMRDAYEWLKREAARQAAAQVRADKRFVSEQERAEQRKAGRAVGEDYMAFLRSQRKKAGSLF